MLGPKMRDKGSAVCARRIVEAVGRRVSAVEQDHALQARRDRWERAAVTHRFGLAAADDPHAPPADHALEAFARALAYLVGVDQCNMCLSGGVENGLG